MKRITPWRLVVLTIVVCAMSRASLAQILQLAEQTTQRLAALDRSKTAVVVPGAILEQHGPYLPSYSDGYLNDWLTQRIAEAVVARPGWTALVFPSIPLGNSGANDVGMKYSFSGTYTVRFATLRAVFMDLADELGNQGFRWVFIVHLHGAPNHSRALDQAGDYFHDTYGGWMVHLAGLNSVLSAIAVPKSQADEAEDGYAIHAGMDETSWMLFLKPALVDPAFRQARPAAAATMEGLVPVAKAPDWPGYLGSPRLATASHGAAVVSAVAARAIQSAMQVLDGTDPRKLERFATVMERSPTDVLLDAASLQAEAQRERRQQAWIAKHGFR
jgi:creatinine amidohydrolase/Fe(II)-dependent formamide hydrolase-like protein